MQNKKQNGISKTFPEQGTKLPLSGVLAGERLAEQVEASPEQATKPTAKRSAATGKLLGQASDRAGRSAKPPQGVAKATEAKDLEAVPASVGAMGVVAPSEPAASAEKAPAEKAPEAREAAAAKAKAFEPRSPEPTAMSAEAAPSRKAAEASSLPAKKPVDSPAVVAKKSADASAAAAKKGPQRQGFKTHEFIVYPAHGVGQIMAIEEQEVAGYKLELFVISFAKDKMTLRVPTMKVGSVGMRKLAEPGLVSKALETLKGRARVKRTMWSRRAQEYEAKINSGDIVAISEVVRDLYRSESQPEQSYSERQLYEAALDRLSREIAAVERLTETEAVKQVEAALAKGPRRGPKGAEEADEGLVGDEEAEAA